MGIRFRIANYVMRDYLRNYLVVGIKLPLLNMLKYHSIENSLSDFQIYKIEDMLATIDELLEM